MKRRGQIQLSFGMIFSIILIIVTVAIAFYVITFFLGASKCAEIGFFYQDLEDRVDRSFFASRISSESFPGSLPSEVESVCFGRLADQPPPEYEEEHSAIWRRFRHETDNVFLYPPENSCGKESASYNLKNAESDAFFCVPVVDGETEIILTFDRISDTLVQLEKP